MRSEEFNQKSLLSFEKLLEQKIKETIGSNETVKVREKTAPATQRRRQN